MERYLRVNLLRLGPRLIKKRICRAAVSQRLRNTAVEDVRIFRGIRFLQLWPVIHSVNKADDCRSQSHGLEKKIKLEEEAISETLVADTDSESGAEASDVEDYFEEEEKEEQKQQ